MNKNEKFVITINRELGSGGRTVGRKLVEKLGVAFYDKALIKALQEKFNLTVEEIERLKGQKKSWWDDVKRVWQIGPGANSNFFLPQKGSGVDLLDTKEIFEAETLILQDIAFHESCVVAGRTGFMVFRQWPNHLSIFIQASMEHRIQRIMNRQNVGEQEARDIIAKVDASRETYIKKYEDTSRYDTRNYQLVISMDDLSEDDAVEVIMDYIDRTSK